MEGVRQANMVQRILFITILTSCLLIVFSAVLVVGFMRNRMGSVEVILADTRVQARVASTPESRQQGLSGTRQLKPDEGMLFVYTELAAHDMWMKDMQYPLDILWLDEDKRVVHMVKKLEPSTYPDSFGSPVPAKYVLEVPSGFLDSHKIKIGTIAAFSHDAVY